MDAVLQLYVSTRRARHPCRGEGLPVALLESGGGGGVPVISNLASGIPECRNGVHGYRPERATSTASMTAVAAIAADRQRLERMSAAVRDLVGRAYDARVCTAATGLLRTRHGQRKPGSAAGCHTAAASDRPVDSQRARADGPAHERAATAVMRSSRSW